MATGVDLYKTLKPRVGEVAARMIAEALPMSDRVATKADIDRVLVATKADIDRVIASMATKEDLSQLEARTFRWMLGFFATLWLGNAGVIVTLLIRG